MAYLNEGVKTILRVSYALCYILKDQILALQDVASIKDEIKSLGLTFDLRTQKSLLQTAFSLSLSKLIKPFNTIQVSVNEAKQSRVYYYPKMIEESNILDEKKLETLWNWLPMTIVNKDANLIFSTAKQGKSYSNLLRFAQENCDMGMILVIQTIKGEIFGAYCSQMLNICTTSSYIGNEETFLFTLFPKESHYISKEGEQSHLYVTNEYFSFGIGPGLCVKSDLESGYSYKCLTYGIDSIIEGEIEFEIDIVELYTI